MIFYDFKFVIFGGGCLGDSDDTALTAIVSFDPDTQKWSKIGEMNQARQGHNMIRYPDAVYVIGGMDPESIDDLYTEKCYYNGPLDTRSKSFECVSQQPVLTSYTYYPELKLVNENYCLWIIFYWK